MEKHTVPNWVKPEHLVTRPNIDEWVKPTAGSIDGTLIWKGKQPSKFNTKVEMVYAVQLATDGKTIGFSESYGLRELRTAKVGKRVFIQPGEMKPLKNGNSFQQFIVFAEERDPMVEMKPETNPGATPSEDVPF